MVSCCYFIDSDLRGPPDKTLPQISGNIVGGQDPRPFCIISKKNIQFGAVSDEIADVIIVQGVGLFPHSLITKLKDTGVRYAPRRVAFWQAKFAYYEITP